MWLYATLYLPCIRLPLCYYQRPPYLLVGTLLHMPIPNDRQSAVMADQLQQASASYTCLFLIFVQLIDYNNWKIIINIILIITMLVALITRLQLHFRHNPKKDLLLVKQQRVKNKNKCLDLGFGQACRLHDVEVYSENLYGKDVYVVALTPESGESAETIKKVFDDVTVSHVIMGGYNNSRLISDRIVRTFDEKKMARSYDAYLEPQRMFCKKLTASLVTKLMFEDPFVDQLEETQMVVRYDFRRRFVDVDNYLTIMRRVHQREFLSQLLFGAPSDYILFEDMMLSYELARFRECFESAWKQVYNFKNQLGDRTDSISFEPEEIISELKYHALFEPMLYNKQMVYSISLLHRFTPISNKCLIFCPFTYARELADNMHKIALDPMAVFRGGHGTNLQAFIDSDSESGRRIRNYLHAEDKEAAREELIEKMVILNMLKSNTLEIELLENKQNIFAKTVFAELFRHLSIDDLISLYQQHKSQYMQRLGQIVQQRLSNLQNFEEPVNHFHTLTEMIKVQDQRLRDFPVAMLPLNKEIDLKTTRDRREIEQEVLRMVRSELSVDQKELMENHLAGDVTREGIILFSKLFVEAKIRLGKSDFKLPHFFYSELSGVFKQQMKDAILKKNLKQAYIKKIIKENKKEEDDHTRMMKQLESDPEAMEKFLTENAPVTMVNQSDGPGAPQVNFSFQEDFSDPTEKEGFLKKIKGNQLLKEAMELYKGDKNFIDQWESEAKQQGQNVFSNKKQSINWSRGRSRGIKMPRMK